MSTQTDCFRKDLRIHILRFSIRTTDQKVNFCPFLKYRVNKYTFYTFYHRKRIFAQKFNLLIIDNKLS